jgi:hypothetical protein
MTITTVIMKISDETIYQTYVAAPPTNVYTIFPAETFKVLYLPDFQYDAETMVWPYNFNRTQGQFKKSYKYRVTQDISNQAEDIELLRAQNYCMLYEKWQGGETLNTREQNEVDTYRWKKSKVNAYTSALEIVTWKEDMYKEQQRLCDLVDACVDIESVFAVVENFPVYPS